MEGRRARKPAPRVKEQRPFRVPCVQHNGRKCLLRAPQRTGSDEWVSGTISNCKGGDDPVADVLLDDGADGKPHRIHLLREMVRIAVDVVWGGAHIDSVDLISTGDGAVEPFVDGLEPVLIFAPFGQPDDDNTSDQLLAQSLVDNKHFWISMEATRNFVLHTWKRKIEPPLKKAVLQALEYKKQFDAWHMNEKFRKKIVGRRIAVWCDSAMTWCCGEIQSYEKSSLQHSIIYDSKNTQSSLDVSNEVVHLLSDSEEENRFDVYSEQGKCCYCARFGLRAKLTSRGMQIVLSRRQEMARRQTVASAPSQTRPTKSSQSTSPAAFEATAILRTTAAERAERAKRKAEQETGLTTTAVAYSCELDWGCKKLKAESGTVEVMPLKAVLTAREDEPPPGEEAENQCELGADAPRVEEEGAGEEEGHGGEEDAGGHGSWFEGKVHGEVGQDANQHFSRDDTKPAYTGDALHCSNCWDTLHFECMDKRLDLVPEHWAEWRCAACKECHVCKSKGRLAICDTCDRGFHIACLDPPLKGFPFRAFKCPDCVQCSSCGTTNAKLWAKDYTMCQTCERAFSMKKFCPICLSAHRIDDGALVKCTRCQFSIHPGCDGMDSGMVEMKSKPDSEYACPNCRGERTSTLLLQVLDKLQREDRDGFFAEPVPVEYAVAMQYHTVVDSPMDFKTMREKIVANAYGSDSLNDSLDDAVAAFRKDFELICTNAMAFHRPNEKCHIKAKRLLPFGVGCILSTFPWSKPADHAEEEHPTANLNTVTRALQPQQQDTLSAQPPLPANGVLLGTVDSNGEKRAVLLESEWDFNATVSFTTAAGASELEVCFVCGACELEDSSSRSSMLRCWHCAEAFHVFCTPPPCPEINEDTIVHWICPRCRPPLARKLGDEAEIIDQPTMRCGRCDRPRPKRAGAAKVAYDEAHNGAVEAFAYWICSECRCCEGCGTRVSRSWSADGVWCAACGPAGFEGRYCGVCGVCYDDDDPFAKVMVKCDTCGLWIHAACDGMDEQTYAAIGAERPGYGIYECPDCADEAHFNTESIWRTLSRLVAKVQHRRLQFSPELLSLDAEEPGISSHSQRKAACLRWVNERAHAGVDWAVRAQSTMVDVASFKEILGHAQEMAKHRPDEALETIGDIDSFSEMSDVEALDAEQGDSKGDESTHLLAPTRRDVSDGSLLSTQQAAPTHGTGAANPMKNRAAAGSANAVAARGMAVSSMCNQQSVGTLGVVPDTEDTMHCEPCESNQVTKPSEMSFSAQLVQDRVCVLCGGSPYLDECGRMLPLGVDGWVHVNCALWSSEVFEKEEGVLHQVVNAVQRAHKSSCAGCGLPGASIGCQAKRCLEQFHFKCARSAGCSYLESQSRSTFCPHHTPKDAAMLPTSVTRSIRLKQFARVQTLSKGPARQADTFTAETPQVVLRIGALTVLRLGKPQPNRPHFHDAQQIRPLGFTSRRRFHDLIHPGRRTNYLCEVRELNGLPNFAIQLESDASTIFAGRTPLEAWLSLQSRRSKLASKRSYASTFSPERQHLEAAAFFGFGLPAVAQLIEQLPGAKACEGFQPRYSRADATQRAPPRPQSVSGCARTDPVIRRPSTYKAALEMYYRPFINRGELPCPELHMKPPPEESAEGKSDSVHLRKREVERSVGVVERGSNATATALKQPMPVEVRRSPIHNWGLFTTRPVPKDGIVVEYKGRELRNTVADRKEKWYEAGAIKGQGGDCYMFRLDEECVLDATTCGNAARFMNHCCTPNCYCKVVEGDKNKKHIVIFAQRDLEEGEEVTYDYKFPVEKAKIPCHCGAPKCLKIMN